jgi:signal transduction histidine kinase
MLSARIIVLESREILVSVRDVTQEREQQERLYQSHRLASVGEMVGGLAHELNNPLTGVIGLAQLLLEDEMSVKMKEDITDIYEQAQRAGSIVKNLLSFARRHAPVKAPVQMNKIVDDVLKLRAYEHTINNIQVERKLAPELPEVMADYFQLQQVFLNLILNAEQAMLEAMSWRSSYQGGKLTITSEEVGGRVKLSFTDDGPGIPESNLTRIFDPFFTTKEVGKGTGLGLSICYGIITAHNGRIYAQSELGKGTTFIVELPVVAGVVGGTKCLMATWVKAAYFYWRTSRLSAG